MTGQVQTSQHVSALGVQLLLENRSTRRRDEVFDVGAPERARRE